MTVACKLLLLVYFVHEKEAFIFGYLDFTAHDQANFDGPTYTLFLKLCSVDDLSTFRDGFHIKSGHTFSDFKPVLNLKV